MIHTIHTMVTVVQATPVVVQVLLNNFRPSELNELSKLNSKSDE
jgi:hypothetical protein